MGDDDFREKMIDQMARLAQAQEDTNRNTGTQLKRIERKLDSACETSAKNEARIDRLEQKQDEQWEAIGEVKERVPVSPKKVAMAGGAVVIGGGGLIALLNWIVTNWDWVRGVFGGGQ